MIMVSFLRHAVAGKDWADLWREGRGSGIIPKGAVVVNVDGLPSRLCRFFHRVAICFPHIVQVSDGSEKSKR